VRGRPLLTGFFALLFMLVFLYNVLRNVEIQLSGWTVWRLLWTRREVGRSSAPDSAENQEAEDAREPQKGRSVLRWTAILGSLLALVLVGYVYTLVFVSGLHFVVIASAPNKESAVSEIQSLNRYFEENGYSQLEARAYASTASGSPWYMISIGGWHTSKKAAEATFREAKQALGPRMRPDAYIYSTENISPVRQIFRWIRRLAESIIDWRSLSTG